MKKFLLVAAIPFTLILNSSILIASETCLENLEQKCTGCHYNTRICKKIAKKSKRAWKSTVKRMLRYGMKMDKAEQDNIVDCLLELKKDSGEFCK